MRLLIYETTHHEILPSILDLSNDYFESISVFLYADSYENLIGTQLPEVRWPKAKFFKKQSRDTNRQFINAVFEELKNSSYSHIHISTLHDNLLYFTLRLLFWRKLHLTLTIHSINSYKIRTWNSIRSITESIAKKILDGIIDYYLVLLPAMTHYFETVMPGKKVIWIPAAFFSGSNILDISEKNFKIIIPGTIEKKRKDYDFVLSFLSKYLSSLCEHKTIELVLLGEARREYAQRVIDEMSRLKQPNFNFVYFSKYVSQAEYEQHFNQAHVVWCPIQVTTIGVRETGELYGVTQTSGVIGDTVRFGKPALINSEFEIPEQLKGGLIQYGSSEELFARFKKLIDTPDELKGIYNRINDKYSALRKENFRESFERLLGLN